jgi:hypothetical protein
MTAPTIDLSALDLEFADAAPVKREGAGRKAEPNRFEDIVKAIALKKDDNGQPLAKTFVLPVDSTSPDGKKIVDKALRQLSAAGLLCNPQVSVRKSFAPDKYKNGKDIPNTTRITFWTVEKKADESETENTTQQ